MTRSSRSLLSLAALLLAAAPLASCKNSNEPVATQVTINGGAGQTAAAGSTLPVDPSVIVQDQAFNPVSGYTVTFSVTQGGGTITSSHVSSANAVTDASGVASVSWTLGGSPGPNQLTVTAVGLAGSGLTIGATGN